MSFRCSKLANINSFIYHFKYRLKKMVRQIKLFTVTPNERKRNLCSLCRGHKKLCNRQICPLITKALTMIKLEKKISNKEIYGSSPPAILVGSWNYPKVFTGPLVPPITSIDTSIMDSPELWLNKSFEEILQYRYTLIRGKSVIDVDDAKNPNRLLSTFQEGVMASKPVDTEIILTKKPHFSIAFSPREPPFGPSAPIERTTLTENPTIPKKVDDVVSDTDLKADYGVFKLYQAHIPYRQIIRLFSMGLLGIKKQRKLVPTEWSITAIDDIVGRSLHREILDYPWINEFQIFGHQALGNNVQVLLIPNSWMFEALEVWFTSTNPHPINNYELVWGRRSYAKELAGAYYAARLPVLEYLKKIRRQAAAIVLLEVYPEWIPIGIWRFREICREAFRKHPINYNTFEESKDELQKRVKLPIEKWFEKSKILKCYHTQTSIFQFIN